MTEFDIRQSVLRSALNMAGTAVNATVDTILIANDPMIGKLFEDRNIAIYGGGIIAVPAAGTSVTFSANLFLHVNSQIAGGTPTSINLGSATASFPANLTMLYAVINRVGGTAVLTAAATSLPAVSNANQEVVLIAKRVDASDGTKRVYFRNGFTLSAGQSARLGGVGTVFANEFSVVDATDTTKAILFQASGAATTTSTTLAFTQTANRVITFPDATTTVVGTDTTQTLSNKQIQFSVSTDSTTTGSDATLQAFTTGVIRLTNVSLLSVGGIPAGASGQLVIIENKTGNQVTINNEDLSDTAANRIQTGTGAPVSMPSNATFMFTYDTTAARWELTGGSGSGSGGGTKNYLTSIITSSDGGIPNVGNGNFELGTTTGWSEFTTTMTGVIPSGAISAGDAAHTLSVVTGGLQLAGNYSLDWSTVTLTGTAGEGFISDPFFIDKSDQVKILNFSFSYNLEGASTPGILNFSGTSANTFAVYIYDVTNSKWIQPVGVYNMTQSSGTQFVTGSFQTNATSTEYRIAVLIANSYTGTTAIMYFDDFSVGPNGPFSANIDPLTANVGSVILSAVATAPPGFLPCDGTAYSRTQYAALFAAIGITHGQGNGSTTFNVPDYRARFIRGTDNMGGPAGAAGRDPDVGSRTAMNTGGNVANAVGSVQTSIFTSHNHTIWGNNAGNVSAGNRFIMIASPVDPIGTDGIASATFAMRDIGNVQNTGGSETRPINAYGNFYIRYLPQVAGNGVGVTGAVAFLAQGTSTVINSTSQTQLLFNSITTDTNSGVTQSTFTSYTIAVSGIYNMNFSGGINIPAGSGAATAVIDILRNGTIIGQNSSAMDSAGMGGGNSSPLVVSLDGYFLNAGDVITVSVATNNSIANTSINSAIFSVVLNGGGVQATQSRIFQAPTETNIDVTGGGSFTTPIGCLYMEVICIGGGGGGGGALNTAGCGAGGGGAGSYCQSLLYPTAGQVYSYSVGGPSSGGTTAGTAGQNGNATTFGSMSAGGGAGGGGGTNGNPHAGGAGGIASGGTKNAPGGQGGVSTPDGAQGTGGNGGASWYGSGGYGGQNTVLAPTAGGTFGAGGGGGGANSGGQVGGGGAQGTLLIKCYFQ
jgi:microcystin-dependent protein